MQSSWKKGYYISANLEKQLRNQGKLGILLTASEKGAVNFLCVSVAQLDRATAS